MYRLLPLVLLILLVSSVYLYLPARRFIVYNLHLSGDPTQSCCSVEEALSSTGEFNEIASVAIFDNQVIDYPKTSLAQTINSESLSPDLQVLGTSSASGEEKWIDVSLSEQMLRAYEGAKVVMEFPISSGKWASTPKGTFEIWYKTRAQVMKGGSKALGTYYYLPNVPHNMFFYKGYAVHGAYWHNNFGHPMSHGCVNSPLAQVAQLFEWAGPIVPEGKNVVRASPENPGTRVVVH